MTNYNKNVIKFKHNLIYILILFIIVLYIYILYTQDILCTLHIYIIGETI